MNFRLTAILFLVVLLLVGGLLLVVLIDDKPTSDVLLPTLTGLKADDIEVVEITRTEPGEEKLVMARTGKDRWEYRDGTSGRLDLAAVNRTIDTLLKLKPTTSPQLTADPSRHGLDNPSLKVTLKSSHGNGTLNIGDTTVGGDKAVTFVANTERADTPVAVKRSDIAGLFRENTSDGKAASLARWTSDYRLRRLLGVDLFDMTAQAKQIKLSAGGKDVDLARGNGTEWKFDAPPGYGLVEIAGDPDPKATGVTGLRALTVAFTTLQPGGPDDFIENPEPLEKYGLGPNDKDVLRIEVVPNDGAPDTLLIGKKIDAPGMVKYFAKTPGDKVVMKITGDRIEAIRALVQEPRTLQDRTLVKELDVPRIDAVDVNTGGSKTTLRKVMVASRGQWVLYGGSEPQIAGPAVAALLSAVAQPRAALEALSAPADAMFAANEIKSEIKLWIDGIAEKGDGKAEAIPPEPKLKGVPTMTLLFGKVDKDKAWCRRTLADGSKIDFIVPAALATAATKKRLDFFDPKLKEFATNLARKLTFYRGAEIFELDRSDKAEPDFLNGKWTFAKPDRLKGQVADSDTVALLLGNLAMLNASSVVAENPNDTERTLMGLNPPRLKATVTLADDKEKERAYEFGNETADKAYVHFRDPKKPLVDLVPKATLDPFLTGELRDLTPYRFDAKDVTGIRLKGWKSNAIHELSLVREGENWVIAGPMKAAANANGVGLLIHFLRAPKPDAIIGEQAPEHGFDAAKGGDPLEVTFLRAKDPITITIGNLTPKGDQYYAWNNVTKTVMTVPKEVFKQFKDGPEMLKK